jgi:hypothetical protein
MLILTLENAYVETTGSEFLAALHLISTQVAAEEVKIKLYRSPVEDFAAFGLNIRKGLECPD